MDAARKRLGDLSSRLPFLRIAFRSREAGEDEIRVTNFRKAKKLYPSEVWRLARRERIEADKERAERLTAERERREKEEKDKRWQAQMKLQFERKVERKRKEQILAECNDNFLEQERVTRERLSRRRLFAAQPIARFRTEVAERKKAREADAKRKADEDEERRKVAERERKEAQRLDIEQTDAWTLSLGRKVGVLASSPRPKGKVAADPGVAVVTYALAEGEAHSSQDTAMYNLDPIERFVNRFPRVPRDDLAAKFPYAFCSKRSLRGQ